VSRGLRLIVLAVATLAAALGMASGAGAASDLEIGIEDERILLDDFARAPAAVADWQALGITLVRIHARWGRLAPGPQRPSGFSGSDPADPRYDWTELDRAVGLVRAAGLKIALTVTGPGPLWTSAKPSLHNPRYKPSAAAFGAFARAVARRYRGQIDRYLIWNEPNIAGWLDPQLDCVRKRVKRRLKTVCTPVAPHLYRSLVRAAAPAIRASDPGAEILVGELAPKGNPPRSNRSPMAPFPFYQAFGCVDARLKPIRTGACRGFKPATADGIGHHPHPVELSPETPSKDPTWAKMGDLPRFEKLLRKLVARGRIRLPNRRLSMDLTEFGYQTSPPDHATGITLGRQSAWLQQAAYLAWRDPYVHSLTYYQWEDEPVRFRGSGSLAYAGWQSGLRYVDGRPKPALQTFAAPLVADRARKLVWGQVRTSHTSRVTVERNDGGGFEAIATVPVDSRGYWSRSMKVSPGDDLRFSWADATRATPQTSGVLTVQSSARAQLSAAR
jgi:hypothetical protein